MVANWDAPHLMHHRAKNAGLPANRNRSGIDLRRCALGARSIRISRSPCRVGDEQSPFGRKDDERMAILWHYKRGAMLSRCQRIGPAR